MRICYCTIVGTKLQWHQVLRHIDNLPEADVIIGYMPTAAPSNDCKYECVAIDRNASAPAAWNAVLTRATGDYVIVVEPEDDTWPPLDLLRTKREEEERNDAEEDYGMCYVAHTPYLRVAMLRRDYLRLRGYETAFADASLHIHGMAMLKRLREIGTICCGVDNGSDGNSGDDCNDEVTTNDDDTEQQLWERMLAKLVRRGGYLGNHDVLPFLKGTPRRTIYLHRGSRPRKVPLFKYTMMHLLAYCQYELSATADGCDLAISWEDRTLREALPSDMPSINALSTNVTKRFTDRVHRDVFGYGLMIERPTEYSGVIVCKMNKNCTCNGRFLEGPLERKVVGRLRDQGMVLQRLVDDRRSGNKGRFANEGSDVIVEYRAPYIAGTGIPFVYEKYKYYDTRFVYGVLQCDVNYNPEALFGTDTMNKICRLCERMGVEYGELDVLRDNHSGLFYVIDVNNTPSLRDTAFSSPWDRERSIRVMARAVEHLVESKCKEGRKKQ